ncbi:PqqD family protein [uncultured Trichococcus sp.]|uniref:PqqD family protein n=1 Tax=uncultured Trichococcus sp. TaxID=189665 RepID=UPI003747F97A
MQNTTASEIFQLCDGNNNINDISTLLSKKYNQPFKETFNIVKEFINLSSLNKDIDLINTAEYKEIKVTGVSAKLS